LLIALLINPEFATNPHLNSTRYFERTAFSKWLGLTLWAGVIAPMLCHSEPLIHSISVSSIATAPEDGTYWMQARPAILPNKTSNIPIAVITLQKTDRVGTHMYHGLEAMWSRDFGKTWTSPQSLAAVDRMTLTNGMLEAPVDMTPKFHNRSGKLLVTGTTFLQDPALHRDVRGAGSATAYAVFDPKTDEWNTWRKLAMPSGPKFLIARAGCTQRVDLSDGDILLPIYFRAEGSEATYSTVLRCSFDGTELRYREQGNEMTVTNDDPQKRKGLHEPSLAQFKGRYFLTIRNDERGYVTTSKDGLHFEQPKPWRFDDGRELGSYNTQQHWVTHSDQLFLCYTRRGATNDNVFRHRAPLFIAEVDTEKLVVIRTSEQVALPNLGAAFGNFGVCNVSADETWIVDCLVNAKPSEPNVFLARIRWVKPNQLVSN